MRGLHGIKVIHFSPDFSQSVYLSKKSSESCRGSHSGLILLSEFNSERSRNSQAGNEFPASKAKDVEFWSSVKRGF